MILEDIHIGDSIAVNGICLTVVSFDSCSFTVDVMPETVKKTSLRELFPGVVVNLERAMAVNGRFGGHLVSGHIDGTGIIQTMTENEIAVICQIRTERSVLEGIVPKGSVTLDGISLTVVDVMTDSFTVSLIPHTRSVTNFKNKRTGDPINIETDMIGKYVRSYLDSEKIKNPKQEISMEFLSEKGFL